MSNVTTATGPVYVCETAEGLFCRVFGSLELALESFRITTEKMPGNLIAAAEAYDTRWVVAKGSVRVGRIKLEHVEQRADHL